MQASRRAGLRRPARSLDGYLARLEPGGLIVTDRGGMGWSVKDVRWRLTYDDLMRLERTFPVGALRLDDSVYALRSRTAPVA